MLPSAEADQLLSLLSAPDVPLTQLAAAARDSFPASAAGAASAGGHATRLHAASSLARWVAQDAEQLRPMQTSAAVFILAHLFDDSHAPDSSAAASAAAATAAEAEEVRWELHPFLHTFLERLDQLDALLSPANSSSSSAPASSLHAERSLLLRLLTPARGQPSLGSLSARQVESLPPAARDEAQLDRLRQVSRLNAAASRMVQATPALPPHPPPLESRLSLPPESTLRAILGEETLQSLRSAMKVSSSGDLSLILRPPVPHFSPPPPMPLLWSEPETESEPAVQGEIDWMRWPPPHEVVWDVAPSAAAPAFPASAAAPSSGLAASLSKALRMQLPASERAQVIAELRSSGSAHPSDDVSGGTASAEGVELAADPWSTLRTALQLVPPSRLSMLVEKNHEVAKEMLLQCMRACVATAAAAGADEVSSVARFYPFDDDDDFSALAPAGSARPLRVTPALVNSYLAALVSADMSLHGMELVKTLALDEGDQLPLRLPSDFLHRYICGCIQSCARMGERDKFLQTRHVRLICVFLQALLRHKLILLPPSSASASSDGSLSSSSSSLSSSSPPPPPAPASTSAPSPPPSDSDLSDVRDVLLVEVQAFLVEFSRIREAANLYKQIKQMEAASN